MALRVIYRSYGGENKKDRPDFYDKSLCLASFLRAAEEAGVAPVFINDGPIPENRLRLMREAGEIVPLPGVGMRGSYLAALRRALDGRWNPEDVVWFSEDDYLYRRDALVRLDRAEASLPEAAYFALYATTPEHTVAAYEGLVAEPRGWRAPEPWQVDGQAWVRVQSTTSSFGARIGTLAEDEGIFRFCMVPHRNMLRDHDTGLLLQGFEPYRYRDVARDALGRTEGPLAARVRGAMLAPFRLATNLRAHRRPARRRLFVAADPNLATHMEDGQMAPGVDWRAVAEETQKWAAGRGMLGSTSAL